jgi:thiamine-monophosphate kinase
MVGIDHAFSQLCGRVGGDIAMTAGVPAGGEFALIDRLKHRLPPVPAGEVGIGDDAAVVGADGGPTLLTTDMSVSGVHADLALMGLDDLGWRAVVAGVSDIAAMGGRAVHVLVAAAGPASADMDTLLEGVAEAVAGHGCRIVGGDLSNAAEVVVAVTVTGVVDDGPGPVLRSGARSGDHLFVTGPLGASAAGLRTLRAEAAVGGDPRGAGAGRPAGARGPTAVSPVVQAHRRPRARLAEGVAARRAGATAMIDVSDGLAADLGHLAEASGVGISLERVPVAPGATVDEALGGGEDYELVFAAADVDEVVSMFAAQGLAPPIVIGVCTPDVGQREWDGRPWGSAGFEHGWT